MGPFNQNLNEILVKDPKDNSASHKIKNMRKSDYVKCIISIMNFLVLSDDEVEELGTYSTPSNMCMIKLLSKYGYDMVTFTDKISEEKLWISSPQEFFGDEKKSLSFFISKLNEYSRKK